jgi:hypothetical protein
MKETEKQNLNTTCSLTKNYSRMILLNSEKQCIEEGGGGGGGGGGGWWEGGREEEETSLGVIMTNTEIKFHILLFKFCFSVSFI